MNELIVTPFCKEDINLLDKANSYLLGNDKFGVRLVKSFSKDELNHILAELSKEDAGYGVILRAKGIVKASDCDKWYYFDLVSGEYELRQGSPDYTGKLCVIGAKLDENKIRSLFFKE